MTRQKLLSASVFVLLLSVAGSAQAVMATTDSEGGGGGYYPATPGTSTPTTTTGSASGSTSTTTPNGNVTTTTTNADGSYVSITKDKDGKFVSKTEVDADGVATVSYAEGSATSPDAIAAMEGALQNSATVEMPTKDELLGDLTSDGIYDKQTLSNSYDHMMKVANGQGVDLWAANMNPDYAKAVADPTNPAVSPLASPNLTPPKENTALLASAAGNLADVAQGVPNELTDTVNANTNSSAYANSAAALEETAAGVEAYMPPGTEHYMQQQ
jgi:hypothetical protein